MSESATNPETDVFSHKVHHPDTQAKNRDLVVFIPFQSGWSVTELTVFMGFYRLLHNCSKALTGLNLSKLLKTTKISKIR